MWLRPQKSERIKCGYPFSFFIGKILSEVQQYIKTSPQNFIRVMATTKTATKNSNKKQQENMIKEKEKRKKKQATKMPISKRLCQLIMERTSLS